MIRLRTVLMWLAFPVVVPTLFLCAILARPRSSRRLGRPRLCWGSSALINNIHWSKAMQLAGWDSATVVRTPMAITRADKWDYTTRTFCPYLPAIIRPLAMYIWALFRFDVFFTSYNGFIIGRTPYWRLQSPLFRIAGKKVVVIPYGSDSWVYHRIRTPNVLAALMESYEANSRLEAVVRRQVAYWVKNADFIIAGFMGFEGMDRWSLLTPSVLHVDVPSGRINSRTAATAQDPVIVAHCPNHRGFKGTKFIIDAVRSLRDEGLDVELRLIEGVENDEVRRILDEECDILVDQVLFTGYALNAIEGMAAGLPVISNLEDEPVVSVLRRQTFLAQCPIISAGPENLRERLRTLVLDSQQRKEVGFLGREYVRRFHSLDEGARLFGDVVSALCDGQKDSVGRLMNYYEAFGRL